MGKKEDKEEEKKEKFLTELTELTELIEKIKESTSKTPPQKMTGIYLEKKENEEIKENGEIKEIKEIKNMKFFIGSLDKEELVEIDGITAISESAFANSDAENILFKGKFSSIRKSAFENCDKLKTVIFGELGADEVFKVKKEDKEIETSILKNVKLASATDDNLTIQTNAFKGCSQLTTLILPKVSGKKTLTIEKDAFSGCEKLRSVVAICDEAVFTGNPFTGCPAHLTFVCEKDSKVDRFARENGYRSVYVD